ncbi:MAG: site-2 protease family protein [Pseudomonadota bacterium]
MFTDLKIPAHRRPMTRGESLTVTIIAAVITTLIFLAIFEEYSNSKLGAVFILSFWGPLLVLHELGHAWMARAVGWKVKEIVIGFGREMWSWKSGETRVRIKLVPLEGYVLPSPSSADGMRWKSALVYAAGPGIELILLLILILLFGWNTVFGSGDDVGQIALKSLAIAIIIGAGFNLIPFKTDGGISDGLGILSSPFMSDNSIQWQLAVGDIRELNRLISDNQTEAALSLSSSLASRFPNNADLLMSHACCMAAAGNFDAARQLTDDNVARTEEDSTERFRWLTTRVWIELEATEPDVTLRDRLIAQALASNPRSALFLFYDGITKVRSGRYEQGGELLANAWRRNEDSTIDAEILLYLHFAAAGIGETEAAEYFLSTFKTINRSKRLTARLERAS